jgi:hypothetical protein
MVSPKKKIIFPSASNDPPWPLPRMLNRVTVWLAVGWQLGVVPLTIATASTCQSQSPITCSTFTDEPGM